MPDLNSASRGRSRSTSPPAPLLLFKVRVAETGCRAPIHTAVLRCQVRIEPARRRYAGRAKRRAWWTCSARRSAGARRMRPMLWTHAVAVVPPFTGSAAVDVPVPCSYDFNVAADQVFRRPGRGAKSRFASSSAAPIFYEADDGALQVGQIAWEKEATYRLPVAVWKDLMGRYYPNCAWLSLRKDVFDRLARYKSRQGLPTWEQALERLLAAAGGAGLNHEPQSRGPNRRRRSL